MVEGVVTLRTPAGEQELTGGDVELFPTGPDGAHQVFNHTEEPVRLLMISTMQNPEVVEYPDSDKVGAIAWPFGDRREDALIAFFPRDAEVDYFNGES